MTVPTWVKLVAALLPIAVSPLIYALGANGRSGFVLGLIMGAFFGVVLALPHRVTA